jgi:hypothetical protein
VESLEPTLARHRAFWTRAEIDRPLLSLKPPFKLQTLEIPVRSGVELAEDGYLQAGMLDPERHFRQMIGQWQDAGPVDGDLLRILTPYLYVPWLEAICGCPIHYFRDSGTMYTELPGGGWDHVLSLRPGRSNPWRTKLLEFYTALADLAAGRYPIGIAMPMRGPIDILAALVGVPEMPDGHLDRRRGRAARPRAALHGRHGMLRTVWAVGAGRQRGDPVRPGGGDLAAYL